MLALSHTHTHTHRFLHPLHNFALVSYNPMDMPPEARNKVRAAKLASDPPIRRGDSVHLVCVCFVLPHLTFSFCVLPSKLIIKLVGPNSVFHTPFDLL